MHHRSELATALVVARWAANYALSIAEPAVQLKGDFTPVTDAELIIEAGARQVVRLAFPSDSFLGEEFGGDAAGSGRTWLMDPIDGTESFLSGGRAWGTLICLLVDDRVVLSVMSRPTENLCLFALAGWGAYVCRLSGPLVGLRRLRIPPQSKDRFAVAGLLEPHNAAQLRENPNIKLLMHPVSPFFLLFDGLVSAVIDDLGDMWDVAPMSLLVEEAGGHSFRRPTLRSPKRGGAFFAARTF